MKQDIIRSQFRFYRQRITELEEQLNEANQNAESAYYREEESISRAKRAERAAEQQRYEQERQVESDRWYREEELRKITRDIERAHSYGDAYGEERAIQKLKRLG